MTTTDARARMLDELLPIVLVELDASHRALETWVSWYPEIKRARRLIPYLRDILQEVIDLRAPVERLGDALHWSREVLQHLEPWARRGEADEMATLHLIYTLHWSCEALFLCQPTLLEPWLNQALEHAWQADLILEAAEMGGTALYQNNSSQRSGRV